MNSQQLMKLTEDEQKGYIYSSVIFSIAKSEERIEKLKGQVIMSYEDIQGFMHKSSKYLLVEEERNLEGLKKFKVKLENGDFYRPKEATKV